MGRIEKHVWLVKRYNMCLSVDDVGNFVEKFYIVLCILIQCVCVCKIDSFWEEIKVKIDAGQEMI